MKLLKKMSDKKQNKNPEKKESKETQQPSLRPKTAEDTAKANLEGKKATHRARVKAGLSELKDRITGKKETFSLNSKDKQLLEKAFGESMKNLSKQKILKKISDYDIDKLEKAEELQEGTGIKVFTNLEFDYKPKKGDKLKINFQGNEDAQDHYGMRTLFKHHPEIRRVKITQKNERGKGREGLATRRGLSGNFYFEDGSYAPIFNNTEIEIVKIFNKRELEEYKKSASSYKVEKQTRQISKEDQAFYKKQYAFETPDPKDKKAVQEYWRQIDNAKSKPKRKKAPRTVSSKEYVPQNELEKQFKKKWDEIMSINDKMRLWNMKDEILCRANDPIVSVPEERAGTRLRSGAALRWALFKRYAQLSGYEVYISSSYRSVKHQRRLWYRGLARRKKLMRKKYPNASASEIHRRALALNRRYVAPPGRSHHNTGGAIDLSVHKNGKKISMRKFRGSRAQYNRALEGNISGLSSKDRKAIETRQLLDKTLQASHFLGTNYYRETWHWNVDKDPKTGRSIYRNV